MWIKDKDGDYYNMDHVKEIYYDGGSNNTRVSFGATVVAIPGDVRDVVIANLVSGTKIMEVR